MYGMGVRYPDKDLRIKLSRKIRVGPQGMLLL